MGRESCGACDAFTSSLAHPIEQETHPTQRDSKVPHKHFIGLKRFSSLFDHFKGGVKPRKFTDFSLLAMPWKPFMEEEIRKTRAEGWGRLMSRRNWIFMDLHWAELGFVCYLDSWVKHSALCSRYCCSLLRCPQFYLYKFLVDFFFFTWNKILWFGKKTHHNNNKTTPWHGKKKVLATEMLVSATKNSVFSLLQ